MEVTDEETVDYVELLESPVYEQHENVEIEQENELQDDSQITHEIVAINSDEDDVEMMNNYEEVQYIESDIDNSILYNDKYTIIVHDGRRYVISTEQLNNGNQTIVLDEEDGEPIQDESAQIEEVIENEAVDSEEMYCTENDEENISSIENTELENNEENVIATQSLVGRQYAVLKDGKLHITNNTEDTSTRNEMQEKLRQLENTLNCYVEDDNESEEQAQDADESVGAVQQQQTANVNKDDGGIQEDEFLQQEGGGTDILSEITGRNLITGQTISLDGFLEKMRRKNDISDMLLNRIPRRKASNHHVSLLNEPVAHQDYVLVPPVNRRVVVGRTQDGKRLIGRILQIQKKIQPNQQLNVNQSSQNTFTISMSTTTTTAAAKDCRNGIRRCRQRPRNSTTRQRNHKHSTAGASVPSIFQRFKHIKKEQDEEGQMTEVDDNKKSLNSLNNPIVKLRYVTRSVLDENVARTLSGLMDMESVNKQLRERRLIVRHVQRCTNGGKVVMGSRRTAYYCGHMHRPTMADNWTFVPENATTKNQCTENGIDLPKPNGDNSGEEVNVRVANDGRMICDDDANDNDNDNESKSITSLPASTVTANINVGDEGNGNSCGSEKETITLYLTETQDEFGKKKTKVAIPEFSNASVADGGGGGGSSSIGALSTTTTTMKSSAPELLLTDGNEHLCQYCGKKFQTLGSLKRHAAVHDHSLRPLQCLTCLGRFTDESSLKKHMILHTGLRPHKCHLCDKNFAHRGDLNLHLRTHDPVKRFECSICKKQFNRHSNMVRHAEIHRPQLFHVPPIVGGQVTRGKNAIYIQPPDHIVLEAQPAQQHNTLTNTLYTCDECGIQYNFSSSLTRHIVNVHMNTTNEVPETNVSS